MAMTRLALFIQFMNTRGLMYSNHLRMLLLAIAPTVTSNHRLKPNQSENMRLIISPTIHNEWQVRSIGDVIPSLNTIPWEERATIEVDAVTADEIRADCEFYIDPKAVDATIGERAAYRGLLKQINAAKIRASESKQKIT